MTWEVFSIPYCRLPSSSKSNPSLNGKVLFSPAKAVSCHLVITLNQALGFHQNGKCQSVLEITWLVIGD